ncbi:hypothetical protein BGZ65_004784 [Modicella reniformis]|uniref:Uncharacterized protein n=1 Tax=Modicella reniformis TaxID=1440133 RepID=A0A9P6MGW8_9FUNG|nr:hypothetical protein BGZ65_004784 [Modicella reniformis]
MFPSHLSRNHSDYHSMYHHKQEEEEDYHPRQPFITTTSNNNNNNNNNNSSGNNSNNMNVQVDYFQSRSVSSFNSAYGYSLMTPKEEERDSPVLRPLTPPTIVTRSDHDDKHHLMSQVHDDYGPSMSPSPSESSCSRESTPSMDSDYMGSMSEASASMSSLVSSSSSSSSMGPASAQLLLCPVCNRAFKPSKNQNCNLRRHLKNVHNMSPTIHPRKCKWDSLPDGRVKDDKDRKERTRKSKRLWARKFRLRRKVEEAAVVLSMLSQAV